MACVDVAFHPIIRRAVAVLLERFEVFRFLAIQLGTLQENGADSARLRAVRILFRFNLGVVLAMDGDPLLCHHAGRQPQPKAEEMRDDGVKIKPAVRLTPVQKNGHRSDRDVRQNQRHDGISPPREGDQAVRHN